MIHDVTRREEQRGWRIAYLWAIPGALVAGLVIVAALYWTNVGAPDTGMQKTNTYGTIERQPVEALGAATLKTEQVPQYGTVLTDNSGHPLYLFEGDQPADAGKAVSTCYEDCAKAWPPLLSSGAPKAAAGTKSSLIGTVSRREGSDQVTYNGWPLYRYAKDVGPQKTVGQDVKDFGAEWYLMKPSGERVGGSTQSNKG